MDSKVREHTPAALRRLLKRPAVGAPRSSRIPGGSAPAFVLGTQPGYQRRVALACAPVSEALRAMRTGARLTWTPGDPLPVPALPLTPLSFIRIQVSPGVVLHGPHRTGLHAPEAPLMPARRLVQENEPQRPCSEHRGRVHLLARGQEPGPAHSGSGANAGGKVLRVAAETQPALKERVSSLTWSHTAGARPCPSPPPPRGRGCFMQLASSHGPR